MLDLNILKYVGWMLAVKVLVIVVVRSIVTAEGLDVVKLSELHGKISIRKGTLRGFWPYIG